MNARLSGYLSLVLFLLIVGFTRADEVRHPTPARLAEIAAALPDRPSGVGLPRTDRAAWGKVAAAPAFAKVFSQAEAYAKQPIPELPDELYLLYSTKGTRVEYETPFGLRTRRLAAFTEAECLRPDGHYLPAIERELAAILSEKTWVAPAHDPSLGTFNGKVRFVDLATASRAWTLATVDYWLGDALQPATRARLRAEVRTRVIEPYLAAVRGAKAAPGFSWITTTNNWNAVCHAGVVGAALALVESKAERAEIIASAEANLTYFISGFTDDGYCSEGLAYWNYGFGHYLSVAEAIRLATKGRIDWFAGEKLHAIGLFPLRLEMLRGLYPVFSDGDLGEKAEGWALELANRRLALERPELNQTTIASVGGEHPFGALMYNVGLLVFLERSSALSVRPQVNALPMRDEFAEAQVFVLRAPSAGFAVAFKGGNNDEHHNHDDLGSYVVAAGTGTPLVDPGRETYTKRTFGPHRYDSKVLNSYGHDVPLVAGSLQSTGPAFVARVLSKNFTDTTDRVVLDLRKGYEVSSLTKLERSFVFERGARPSFTVTDSVKFSSPQKFGTTLITFGPWKQESENVLVVGEAASAARVTIETHGHKYALAPETLSEDMPRGTHPLRLGINLVEPVSEAEIAVTISRAEVKN